MKEKPLLSWKEATAILTAGTILSLGSHSIWHMFYSEGPQHNGQMRMAGPYHVELVMNKDKIEVYLTDHSGNERDVKDVEMIASIGASGEIRREVKLAPAGDNRMASKGQFDLKQNIVVELRVEPNCEQPVKALFTPMIPDGAWPQGIVCFQPEPAKGVCHGKNYTQPGPT